MTHNIIVCNGKIATYPAVCFLFICMFFTACSPATDNSNKELYSIVPFVEKAYEIKDSLSVSAAFQYIDSIKANVPYQDIDAYPIYTFKHNCYLNDINNADSAMAYADSMLAVIERNSDYDWNDYKIADANNAKADAYYYKGNYNEAYKWYNKSKEKFTSTDSCLNGSYNFRIAMSQYKEERYEEAANYFKQSFAQQVGCASSLPQHIRMQEILSNVGLSYYRQKKYDSAMLYYAKAMEYIESNKSTYPNKQKSWHGARAVIYGNIGMLYADRNITDSAELYLKNSIMIDEVWSVNIADMLATRINLAKLYLHKKEYENVKEQADMISKKMNELNLPDIQYGLYDVLWQYNEATGNTKMAFHYLQQYTALKDSFFFSQKKALINDLNEGILENERQHEKALYVRNKRISRVTILALVFISITAVFTTIWLIRVVHKRKHKIKQQRNTLTEIAWLQSHEIRKPVATMMGLLHVFNKEDVNDPNNEFIITSMEEQLNDLDKMIRDINNKASNE